MVLFILYNDTVKILGSNVFMYELTNMAYKKNVNEKWVSNALKQLKN